MLKSLGLNIQLIKAKVLQWGKLNVVLKGFSVGERFYPRYLQAVRLPPQNSANARKATCKSSIGVG
ncbi:hypothetical protein COD09_20710 [Bacillus cereus]|uniref:Uncharacterized protein n=1 Tax=Bacillus cereus TaxID=1396 RepID=A0A2C1DA24_BACCE|nr:hypothetical protein COD09_20710 [Bacillus cereus]